MSVHSRQSAPFPWNGTRGWQSAAFARQLTSVVYEATGQRLEDSGEEVARAVQALLSSEFCMIARYEDGALVCRGVASEAPTRLAVGDSTPIRGLEGRDGTDDAFDLLAERREPEPFAEYLRLEGYRSAAVVPLGNETTTLGVVVFGYRGTPMFSREDLAHVSASLQPLALVLRQSPLTAAESYERHREVVQAQKMEALGSMAGMIAHDFNNLLTTILGYTSILKNTGRLEGEEKEFLVQVETAAHRAAALTSRLLTFARGSVMRTGPLDLGRVVVDTLRLAEPMLHNRVDVSLSLPDEAVAVDGDQGQLQQALLNILLNARDVMPDGGAVRLEMTRRGQTASLRIADNGPGMDAATRERVFDPFFTTKPAGSGTGLGMSITYGILKAHGASIDVQSTPGEGTVFTLQFPARAERLPVDVSTIAATTERDLVLVVDDDDMVRQTTVATLAHLGYNVVEAPSGRVAIELVQARPDRFAMVLLDLVMPDLTGGQTFKELRKIREDLPVVICTGYAADAHLDAGAREQIAGIIYKPFSPERLEETIVALGVRRKRRGRA